MNYPTFQLRVLDNATGVDIPVFSPSTIREDADKAAEYFVAQFEDMIFDQYNLDTYTVYISQD